VKTWIRNGVLVSVVLSVAISISSRAVAAEKLALGTPPVSPAESLRMLHVREGFEVELVAAEPLVVDPVAIDWGPDGKLWVAEMADYPLGIDGQGKAGGRVRFLEDTDGDGRYDKSTVLLDGVTFPTGVMAWGRGVLVTAAPEIFYAEDTDGDGKADVRRTLYSGFLEGNQQLRVNGLRWGLDNWVYCASGSHHAGYGKDSRIKSHVTEQKAEIGSRDFRIRPDEGSIDPQSGPSQYGRNRDDWGRWFGVQNSFPLWHYVLADHYIRRNPHFAPPDPRRQVVTPSNPIVYPAKPAEKRFHSFDQSGRFTSACSAMIYRDELLFGRDASQHAFTCEPFHNLVQHNVITDDGVSFTFHRDPAESKTDFFASADQWCRPVMVQTGPDGALWVVDMYRYMIEHPQWLPQTGKDELQPFYRAGDDRGRIYRVFPKGKPPRKVERLDTLTSSQLVTALESPNGWQRDSAQRLLIAKHDAATVGLLQQLVSSSRQPLTRLHALCTLDGLDALKADVVEAALSDEHPGVRCNAVRLAEGRPVDVVRLARLVGDPDAKVRLQLACTLGEFEDPRAAIALAKLGTDAGNDSYITAAVLSSVNKRNIAGVLVAALSPRDGQSSASGFVQQLFAQAAAQGEDKVVADAIELACTPSAGNFETWQLAALAETLDGLEKRKWQIEQRLAESKREKLTRAIALARDLAADRDTAEPDRIAATRLLLREPQSYAADVDTIKRLLTPQTSPGIQQVVVAHAARRSEKQLASVLLAGWKSHSPALRSQILSVLSTRTAWVEVLLEKLDSGALSPTEIDASMRQRLATTQDAVLRSRLEKIFAATTNADRQQTVAAYQAALKLPGDPTRGKVMYGKLCTNCHKHGDAGHEVGPNLASLTNKTPAVLLTSILDPSSAVEAKYLNYIVVTNDGRILTGMLATETASSLTLLAAEGKQETILRRDIDQLQSTGKSLMPDGLEKDLSPQDLADLIEHVRQIGSADKR
jgi:putative membrane-bound dehydrogenase-like protein